MAEENIIDRGFDTGPVDTQLDTNKFVSGPPVKAEVQTLSPPEDISAANIGEYTPYTADERQLGENETVQGRLGGLLSQNNPYIERARTEAKTLANRRGMLNTSMAAGAAEGAAIDRALPIAQQDAASFAKQHFLNQGYSNDAAQHLADSSVTRENLAAGFEQDTNIFNARQQFEADRLNQEAQNQASTAFAAESNKNNFAVLDADIKGQLASIDNELAKNLETLTREYSILENLDNVQGSIYQQLVNEMGTILATEKDPAVAQAKINTLLVASNAELEFSGGIGGPQTEGVTWGLSQAAGGNQPNTVAGATGNFTSFDPGGGNGEGAIGNASAGDIGNTAIGDVFGEMGTLPDGVIALGAAVATSLGLPGTTLGTISYGYNSFAEEMNEQTQADRDAMEATIGEVAAMLGISVDEAKAMTIAELDEAIPDIEQALVDFTSFTEEAPSPPPATAGSDPGALSQAETDAVIGEAFGGQASGVGPGSGPAAGAAAGSTDPGGIGPGGTVGAGSTGDTSGGGGGGGDSASGDGPGSKILCTTLNDMYGFGSFRNQVWMKYAAEHPDRYLTFGYHKVFFPLARRMRTNRALEKVLTRIVRVRTNRLRREMHGKPISVEQGVYKYGIESALIIVGWLVSKGVISKV